MSEGTNGPLNESFSEEFEKRQQVKEEALEAYKDNLEKKEIEAAGLRPCPHCGYCPTCGRSQNVPYYPSYPYNPWVVSPTGGIIGMGGLNTSV